MNRGSLAKLALALVLLAASGFVVWKSTRPEVDFAPSIPPDQMVGTWKNDTNELILKADHTYLFSKPGVLADGTWGAGDGELLLLPDLYSYGVFPRIVKVDGEVRILTTYRDKDSWDGDLGLKLAP